MDEELLLIPGVNEMSVININECDVIEVIDIPNSNSIVGVCVLNENILFTGDSNGTTRQWKIEGDNLILISQK